jgi:hypothetical protein
MKLLKRLRLDRRPVPRDPEKFEVAAMAIQVESCVAEVSRFSQERGLREEHQGTYGFGDVLLMTVAGPRLDDAARELALLWERLEGSNEVESGREFYSLLVLRLDSAWFGVRESNPFLHLPVYVVPLRELLRQAVGVTRKFAEPLPARQEWPHACAAMAFYLQQGRLAFTKLVGQCVRYQERLGKPGKQSKEEAQTGECFFNLMCIFNAKRRWAIERRKQDGDDLVKDEVDAHIEGGAPRCPAGGTYAYGKVGELPKCSVAGHVLQGLTEAPVTTGGSL